MDCGHAAAGEADTPLVAPPPPFLMPSLQVRSLASETARLAARIPGTTDIDWCVLAVACSL